MNRLLNLMFVCIALIHCAAAQCTQCAQHDTSIAVNGNCCVAVYTAGPNLAATCSDVPPPCHTESNCLFTYQIAIVAAPCGCAAPTYTYGLRACHYAGTCLNFPVAPITLPFTQTVVNPPLQVPCSWFAEVLIQEWCAGVATPIALLTFACDYCS